MHTFDIGSRLMRHGAPSLVLVLGALLGTQASAQAPAAVPSLDALEGTHGHAVATAAAASGEALDDGIDCPAEGPCVETATGVPLRVLPRPFSNAYQTPVANADALVLANLPAFQPLHVFDRQGVDLSHSEEPAGWYLIGRSSAAAEGWMQARDVFEWRQALLVSYTHPGDPIEGRHPVLMFRELAALEDVIDDFDMAGRARALYAAIDGGEAPAELVSMEPQRFVDITRQFYLLPILQWRETRIAGDDLRMLQLAAAVPGARGPDTLASAGYRAQAQVARDGATGGTVPDLNVDVVFVIDTTRSMQPFIDMTREAVIGMTNRLAEDAERRFRFGLVTFRDSTEVIPQIGYATRVHTPKLIDARGLIDRLEQARATEVGSLDYAEEVFAGVDVAMRSSWREGALRLMILIGDASSHPKGHPQNVTGKDEVDLRRELDDAQIHLLAIHLPGPAGDRGPPDRARPARAACPGAWHAGHRRARGGRRLRRAGVPRARRPHHRPHPLQPAQRDRGGRGGRRPRRRGSRVGRSALAGGADRVPRP
jgi:serine/threonine-protein kinase PpkA